MKATRVLVLLVLVLSAASPSRAWDETGHKVVAYIAWQEMTPEARAAVTEILRHAPPRSNLLSLRPPDRQPARDEIHFMRAGFWPDVVRDRSEVERYELYHRAAWHYTNYFWEEGPGGGVVMRSDMHPEDVNIVERLAYLQEVAGNDLYAGAQRAISIAWLEHLVGDIHQPLHTSARVTESEPEGDRGGNLFRLNGRFNLHSYWDRLLSAAYPRGPMEAELSHVARIGHRLMAAHPLSEFVDEFSDEDYAGWARRGLTLATTSVYAGLERGEEPSPEYADRATATAEESVALAGYRLARLMNRLFG